LERLKAGEIEIGTALSKAKELSEPKELSVAKELKGE
jgi:hypothetical protein